MDKRNGAHAAYARNKEGMPKGKVRVPGTAFTMRDNYTGSLGASLNGAVGGHSASFPQILGRSCASEFARDLGCSTDQAYDLLRMFGLFVQRRLLEGHPVGIPFVGAIAVQQWMTAPDAFERWTAKMKRHRVEYRRIYETTDDPEERERARRKVKAIGTRLERRTPSRRSVKFYSTPIMEKFFEDNCAYYAYFKDIARDLYESEKAEEHGSRDDIKGGNSLRASIRRVREGSPALTHKPRTVATAEERDRYEQSRKESKDHEHDRRDIRVRRYSVA